MLFKFSTREAARKSLRVDTPDFGLDFIVERTYAEFHKRVLYETMVRRLTYFQAKLKAMELFVAEFEGYRGHD